MAKSKKFDYQVVQDKSGWSAKIIRKASSKKQVVSKQQDGFATEADAQAWGETELKSFLQQLEQRNKRRALLRK